VGPHAEELVVIDVEKYNFIDFGSGGGDFMDIARSFGGRKGLGIENDPVRVRDINGRGKDCVYGDVRNLQWLPEKCVRFVTVDHLLEHMRTLHDVRLVLRSAMRLANDFVYISGPNFDEEPVLATQGLKFYWADWPNSHPLHLTTSQLAWTLMMEGARKFLVWATAPIKDSTHLDIHPLEARSHSGHYSPAKHPAKPKVVFPRPVYTQFTCVVTLVKSWPGPSIVTKGFDNCPVVQRGPES